MNKSTCRIDIFVPFLFLMIFIIICLADILHFLFIWNFRVLWLLWTLVSYASMEIKSIPLRTEKRINEQMDMQNLLDRFVPFLFLMNFIIIRLALILHLVLIWNFRVLWLLWTLVTYASMDTESIPSRIFYHHLLCQKYTMYVQIFLTVSLQTILTINLRSHIFWILLAHFSWIIVDNAINKGPSI